MPTPESPFEILGVSPSASDADVRRAWKRRISQVHPDVAGEAYGGEAAKVNEAYRRIETEADRRKYRRQTVTVDPGPTAVRFDCAFCGARGFSRDEFIRHQAQHRSRQQAGTCQRCQRRPAAPVHYSGVTGMLFARRHWSFEARVCKSCSRGLYREAQSKLLVTGWWSLLSWIITPFLLLTNTGRMWTHASAVGDPAPSDREVDKMLRGRPVLTRTGPLVVSIAIIALLFGIFSGWGGPPESTSAATPGEATSVTAPPSNSGWVAGNCVVYLPGDNVEPISCDSPDAGGEILNVVSSATLCPPAMEWWVELDSGSAACLNEW